MVAFPPGSLAARLGRGVRVGPCAGVRLAAGRAAERRRRRDRRGRGVDSGSGPGRPRWNSSGAGAWVQGGVEERFSRDRVVG